MPQPHQSRLCIGLPVYNGENYLAHAIESILAQRFTDFRLIISDNASTDGTEEICHSYGRRDLRIEYHRAPQNRGAAWNFNRVAQLADSEYFEWAAHDDVLAPEFVRRCVEVLDRDPRVVLCFTKSQIIDQHGALLSTYDNVAKATAATPYERFTDVLTNLGLCHMQFGVMRRDTLRQMQPYGAYPAADYLLLAELALRGEFHEVGDLLFFRRDHPERPARVYRSYTELAVWFDPANAGRIRSLQWTHLANYLRIIARVPMPIGQKVRCTYLMAKWCRWNSRPLARDLGTGIARVLRTVFRPAVASSKRPDSNGPGPAA